MTTRHFTEADLLETYYTQPGESMPVMLHLAACAECAAKYERLERKLRGLAACDHEKPESFWQRQKVSIQHAVGSAQARRSHAPALRIAAAALLAIVLGGVVVQQQTTQPVTLERQTEYAPEPTDPWESEELQEFGAVVEWESWVPEGDQSL